MSDATEMMKEDLRRLAIEGNLTGRRLSHSERCGAFYALYWGYSRAVVADAFGVTPTTTSLIADCLVFAKAPRKLGQARKPERDANGEIAFPAQPTVDPSRMRRPSIYRKIAEEFLAIGEQAFGEQYFHQGMRDRLLAAQYQRKTKNSIPRRSDFKKPDEAPFIPDASYEGLHLFTYLDGRQKILAIHRTESGWSVGVLALIDGELAIQNEFVPTVKDREADSYDAYIDGFNAFLPLRENRQERITPGRAREILASIPLDKPTSQS
jgi:hypothetical protein